MTVDFDAIRDIIIEANYDDAFIRLLDDLKLSELTLYLDEVRFLHSRYNSWAKDEILGITSPETRNRIINSLIKLITIIEGQTTKKQSITSHGGNEGAIDDRLNLIIRKIETVENKLLELGKTKISNEQTKKEFESLNRLVLSEKNNHSNLSFIESYFQGNDFDFEVFDANSTSGTNIRTPNFLLFKRLEKVILVIVDSKNKVDPFKLQKTFEPQIKAKMLGLEDGDDFLDLSRVSPFSLQIHDKIDRVFIEANILAQAIIFPESKICLPLYEVSPTHKFHVTCDAFLSFMIDNFGLKKIIFGNFAVKSWPDDILLKLIFKSSFPFDTRFAPTPSNQLHIGNARTALFSYLIYLSKKEYSSFHIRFDDTDFDGDDQKKKEAELFKDKIKEDLDWLRIKWQWSFNQSDNNEYGGYLTVLQNVDFIQNIEGEYCLNNDKIPFDIYYNLYFDWRMGPTIFHEYPQDRRKNHKLIKLKRDRGKNFYYRFAGIVDDIRFSTFVVRDFRQKHLTKVQNHIRHYVEKSRQRFIKEGREWVLQSLKISSNGSIPLPIYFHAPLVKGLDLETHEFKILSKSHLKTEDSSLKLYYISELRKVYLPESVIAYLLTTILRDSGLQKLNWKDKIHVITSHMSKLGISKTLFHYAKSFNLQDFFSTKEEINCDIRQIQYADQLLLRKMPIWFLKDRIEKQIGEHEIEDNHLSNLLRYKEYFASFDEVCQLLTGNHMKKPFMSNSSLQFLTQLRSRFQGQNLKYWLLEELNHLKQGPAGLQPELSLFMSDLRILLMGKKSGPPVKILISVLSNAAIKNRVFDQT